MDLSISTPTATATAMDIEHERGAAAAPAPPPPPPSATRATAIPPVSYTMPPGLPTWRVKPQFAAWEVDHGRFEIRRALGKGSYGSVVEAIDHLTGKRVAIKKVRGRAGCGGETALQGTRLAHAPLCDTRPRARARSHAHALLPRTPSRNADQRHFWRL
jgi:hypothetical protein